MAQLITENPEISFSGKREAKSFSCTEELERSVIKRFPKSYNKFAECMFEIQLEKGPGMINSVKNHFFNFSKNVIFFIFQTLRGSGYNRCLTLFGARTRNRALGWLRQIVDKEVSEIDTLFPKEYSEKNQNQENSSSKGGILGFNNFNVDSTKDNENDASFDDNDFVE